MSNLKQRTLAALVLVPAGLGVLWLPSVVKIIVATLVGAVALHEWYSLSVKKGKGGVPLQVAGFLYIILSISSMGALMLMLTPVTMVWLFSAVWATDIFAYFIGRTAGGPKLAPRISPNKTWSGLAGGTTVSMIVTLMFMALELVPASRAFLAVAGLVSLSVHGGDLLESWAKRQCGAKDSGSLIPGHGGVLDRIDGLMSAACVLLLIVLLWVA